MKIIDIIHKTSIARIVLVCAVCLGVFLSCGGGNTITDQNTARVKRGDIESNIEIRCRLEMPHEVKLHFATFGVIDKLYITCGSQVKAGTLLAKLDDTAQRQAVEQAQYSVQLAMNELVEKTYSSIMGYPYYYPSTGVILRFEAAQEELSQTQDLLNSSQYREAMTRLRLAIHDLETCKQLLQPPAEMREGDYPNIFVAMDMLGANINSLCQDTETKLSVQSLINQGKYDEASIKLATVNEQMVETHIIINGISGIIRSYFPLYPDTSTSLDIYRQVQDNLQNIQALLEQNGDNKVETTEQLQIALHDLEMSNEILENSEQLYHHGLNLKILRMNNLNLQKAEKALESAKTELMKTEIIAPFDGIIVDVPVKENEELSAVDYSSRTIVELVDTSRVEVDGYVDERDVRHISTGQTASVFVDVLPNRKFTGKVDFVSPYGNVQTGTASFPVKIVLDPADTLLQRGLAATVVIPVGERSNVLLIPDNAVRLVAGEPCASVVIDRNAGKTEQRPIILGLQSDEYVEVVSGLEENETVILQGLSRNN